MSIKVLTVEDSALIRTIINNTIKRMDGIELIGSAENGKEALRKVEELKPDIITLDMFMPVMNGLDMLKELRTYSDIPVIVLSSTSDELTTMRALEIGAQDFLRKPESITKNRIQFQEELESHIKAILQPKSVIKSVSSERKVSRRTPSITQKINVLAIGASTGGPKVITSLIKELPSNLSIPVFIVQHMPKGFTKSFARRLDSVSKVPVVEAVDNMRVERGVVYVAPGGFHMVIDKHRIRLLDTKKIHGVKPAVDPMFESVTQIYGKKTLGILLTGMGKDGAKGCLKVKEAGGYVLAQNEETCVVYGMPKFAVEAGAVNESLSIDEMILKIKEVVTD